MAFCFSIWEGEKDMADRELTARVKLQETGWTVGKYLRERMGFSRKQISRLKFRDGGIAVNGGRQRVNFRLSEGDILKVRLEEHIGNGKKSKVEPCTGRSSLKICYEDCDLLAVEKPAGIPCHPSHGHHLDTLANQAAAYLNGRGKDVGIRLVGRLDKDTSGIVVFAKNREAAAALSRQRREGRLQKVYVALAEGCPQSIEGTVEVPIKKVPGELMKMQVSPEGKIAATHYRVLKTWGEDGKKRTLLQLNIEQGRTHQIRVHMAYIGCPLVGDPLYGTDPHGKGALLHSWRLAFRQPFTGKEIVLETELPKWSRGEDYF